MALIQDLLDLRIEWHLLVLLEDHLNQLVESGPLLHDLVCEELD